MMIISVNGEPREIDDQATLGDVIVGLGIRRDGIAVARNDDVVSRGAIDTTKLAPGDSVEIIVAVAGG